MPADDQLTNHIVLLASWYAELLTPSDLITTKRGVVAAPVVERRPARVVRSNRRAAVAQTAEEVNAGSDRKVSEYKVQRSLLHMGRLFW